MDTTQLNVMVTDSLATKLKTDSAKSGVSLKDIAGAILSDFFAKQNWESRATLYAKLPNKPSGRKIAIKKKIAAALKDAGLQKVG